MHDFVSHLNYAIAVLQRGGIIAYPTEAVYGLGCDPFNEKAVLNLLNLKHRSMTKGLILLAHSWESVAYLTIPIATNLLKNILKTWPGAMTWVFPANLDAVPIWIRGDHESVAIRITAHPLAQALCRAYAAPIVSTSANLEGGSPARSNAEVLKIFPSGLDYVLKGKVGSLKTPTLIYAALTGKVLRP